MKERKSDRLISGSRLMVLKVSGFKGAPCALPVSVLASMTCLLGMKMWKRKLSELQVTMYTHNIGTVWRNVCNLLKRDSFLRSD